MAIAQTLAVCPRIRLFEAYSQQSKQVEGRGDAKGTRAQTPALLKGLLFGPTGCAMTPTHTRKGGRLYRYYIATDVLKHDAPACTVRRVSAAEIEGAVIDQVRGLLRSPEMIVRTWRAGKRLIAGLQESEVAEGTAATRSPVERAVSG